MIRPDHIGWRIDLKPGVHGQISRTFDRARVTAVHPVRRVYEQEGITDEIC
jgi:hypothetical protein